MIDSQPIQVNQAPPPTPINEVLANYHQSVTAIYEHIGFTPGFEVDDFMQIVHSDVLYWRLLEEKDTIEMYASDYPGLPRFSCVMTKDRNGKMLYAGEELTGFVANNWQGREVLWLLHNDKRRHS